jgi:DNA-binding Lrp family transcriptional regulator
MSRHGIDPRLSADAIARELDVGRTTVQSRFREWKRRGFLRGYEVIPNPALFVAASGGVNARIDDPRDKPKVLENLSLVDGVLLAFNYVGPWIGVAFAAESESALARRAMLIAHLPGVSATEPPFRTPVSAPRVEPTPLDWRILEAFRESPNATFGQLSHRVGVSVKTMARRYRRLVDGNAVWFHADLDYTKSTGAPIQLNLTLDSDAARVSTTRALAARYPRLIVQSDTGVVAPVVQIFLHLDAVGEVEEVTQIARGLPGVREVEVLYPLRHRMYKTWINERIQERLQLEGRRN